MEASNVTAARVSPEEYAEMNSISRMTVYRMLKEQMIPGAIMIRGQWRIPIDSIPAQKAKEPEAEDAMTKMITLRQWAADHCVSYATAYKAVRAGQIPGAIKSYGKWRVPADSQATVKLHHPTAIAEESLAMPYSLTINGVLYVRADASELRS